MSARRVTIAICVILFLDSMAYAIVLPALSMSYGSGLAVGGLFALYSLCQLFSAPLLGRLSDRWGRRPVLLLSQSATVVSLAILALPYYRMAVISRMLDGVTAGNSPVAYAAALEQHESTTWNRVLGWLASAGGLGVLAGIGVATLFGGDLRSAAVAGIVVSILSVAATFILLPKEKPRKAAPVRLLDLGSFRRARSAILGGAAQSAAILPLPAVLVAMGSTPTNAVRIGFLGLLLTAAGQSVLVPLALRMRPALAGAGACLSLLGGALLFSVAPVPASALLLLGAVVTVALGRAATLHRLGDAGVGAASGLTTTATTVGQLVGPLVGFGLLELSPILALSAPVLLGLCTWMSLKSTGHD